MIPVAEPIIGDKELKYVEECVKSGWVSSIGDYIYRFENCFSNFCGTKYGVSCSNGTVALHLALKAFGVGNGDEVIVPALTFIATANAVTYCNAIPVFVDAEPETWNIDPDKIEEKITKKTKAIIPVHLYGHPVDMDTIIDIARENKLVVIEDAAEAHGAEYKGRKVGSIGDVGCFSFYGNKIITTGEGGMITTDNEEIAERARMLRDHAMSKEKRYWHDTIGFNYRLTNLQAALGVAQMERIEDIINIKRSNAKLYNSMLKTVAGITLPKEAEWAKSVYWMYSILIEDKYRISRDELIIKLKERGIDSRPFFYPIPSMPPYKTANAYPVSEELSRKGINLPSSPRLKKDDIKYIVEQIKEISEV
jgi:perosamine synthetase